MDKFREVLFYSPTGNTSCPGNPQRPWARQMTLWLLSLWASLLQSQWSHSAHKLEVCHRRCCTQVFSESTRKVTSIIHLNTVFDHRHIPINLECWGALDGSSRFYVNKYWPPLCRDYLISRISFVLNFFFICIATLSESVLLINFLYYFWTFH